MLDTLINNGSRDRICEANASLIFDDLKSERPSINDEHHELGIDRDEDVKSEELLGRDHFEETFDTDAYLRDFYANVDDPAMQMVIFYLPNIVARIDACDSLLDFGAGPTIHAAVCFREKVKEIYLADFLAQNRAELTKWLSGRSTFNWTKALRMIAACEGHNLLQRDYYATMEHETRERIRAILFCDCHRDPPLNVTSNGHQMFDVITTFYTIEYCCETLDEYRRAIRRIVALLRPGGHFIMGTILQENWCSFDGRKFKCLYVTRSFVLECLRDAGLGVNDPVGENDETRQPIREKLRLIPSLEINGMALFCGRKRLVHEAEGNCEL